jgi:NTP pyrophosphatase (non-canonical NTP hydrolase)
MMQKKLLDQIRILSKRDKKSLSQKALKATEEIGELAKVVLPFENAYATTHRFVERSRILEEVADGMLVLLSIAYDLDYSDDEIEEMVSHKMKYWADLQAREDGVNYPVPYEFHVTVAAEKTQLEAFKVACKILEVKPILLDLHLKDGGVFKDLMTSSTHMGINRTAFEDLKRISTGLKEAGFEVLREKIETIPWHPAAPSIKHERNEMPPNCYFESHLAVLCTKETEAFLKEIADNHGARRSRNVFKVYPDGSFKVMVTYRKYDGVYEEFVKELDVLQADIENLGYEVEKRIVEFSIYDTKVSHDNAWITQT